MRVRKDSCDKCGGKKPVKRIPTGGDSGAFFCSSCLEDEIEWRTERNKQLTGKARFRTKYKTDY